MTEIVRRATVDAIVSHRNHALQLYERAYGALTAARDALVEARMAAHASSPGVNRYNYHSDEEKKLLLSPLTVPEKSEFLGAARKLTDTDVWSHIIMITDLERLMDKKAKDQFHQQLISDPPEATVENILATLDQFALDADTIFKRGMAECFSNLDRRFRSHDGWKIGSRVILSYAFNVYGTWNYHRNHRDTLQDIERTFMVIEGRQLPPSYSGVVGAVEQARAGGFGRRYAETETEYFKVRCFLNGNMHIWFKRDDLVERVNKLLAEYYGAVIPEEREPDEDAGLHNPKTSLAKNYGFFPTPDAAASTLMEDARLYRAKGDHPLTVLEPSAGTGNLARLAVAQKAIVDCIEIHAERARALRASCLYRKVVQADFLAVQPDPNRLYDRVIMNPPFDRERDIDHVMHALKFLKPDGFLCAIMSAGTEFRETKKSTAFRELMASMNASWRDLPAGSFASVGTYCNTLILRVWKSGKAIW